MNETASLIIERCKVRIDLLMSIDVNGMFVRPVDHGLYDGEVHGVPALVPLEYARMYSAKDLQVLRARGGLFTVESAVDMRTEEVELLRAEMAWIAECG